MERRKSELKLKGRPRKNVSNVASAATPKWPSEASILGLGPAHPAIVAVLRGVHGGRRSTEAVLEVKKAFAHWGGVRLQSGAFNGLSCLFFRSITL